MRQALLHVGNNYRFHSGRTIILTDCKFVINALFNKWDSEIYNISIMECQRILKTFDEDNVPEIYWIKGHSGIPGNDKVDLVANNARKKAQEFQPNLIQKTHRSARFLNKHGLNPFFAKQWNHNRHWICEGNENPRHNFPRTFLGNLSEAQLFEKIVLHSLTPIEREVICRLITGKVGLNYYLYGINRSDSPNCNLCDEEETIDTFYFQLFKILLKSQRLD